MQYVAPHQRPLFFSRLSLSIKSTYQTTAANICHQGGTFNLEITFPPEYPFKAPVLSFKTKIYHPNISNDDKGSMCLGLLRPDTWKPPTKMSTVLTFVKQILTTPEPDEAIEVNIAKEFKTNKSEFTKKAKDWTKKYAYAK